VQVTFDVTQYAGFVICKKCIPSHGSCCTVKRYFSTTGMPQAG